MVHLNKISRNACTNDHTHVSVLNGSREVHTYSRKVIEHTYELYVRSLLVTGHQSRCCVDHQQILFVDGHNILLMVMSTKKKSM